MKVLPELEAEPDLEREELREVAQHMDRDSDWRFIKGVVNVGKSQEESVCRKKARERIIHDYQGKVWRDEVFPIPHQDPAWSSRNQSAP